MDSHVPGHVPDDTSPYSAILEDIYKQAQTEIEARNQPAGYHYDATSPPFPSEYPLLDDTYRYEPLSDPSLSFINDILEEDNVLVGNDPSFSYGELVAYQAKTSELAAILKEDSPTLSLNMNVPSQEAPNLPLFDLSSAYVSEDRRFAYNLSNLEVDFFNDVPEPCRNDLLLSSLRGPQGEFVAPDVVSMVSSGVYSHEAQASWQPSMKKRMEQAGTESVDGGASSHFHKHHKAPKKVSILKPRKESVATRKKKRASKEGVHEYVDINDLLLQCANAIGANNTKSAMEILSKVKQHVSPFGNGAQRLAYYFSEALDARFSGMGWPLYMGRVRQRPSSAEILKATCKYMSTCPFAKASHYFINQTILNVAKNASVLHILELQTTGYQYPSLFQALASRPGGPPQVRLTGVGFPHYSMIPAQTEVVLEGLQKTGRQLSEYAASLGVPFHYTAWAGSRETLRMQDFVSPERNKDEVFVVISAYLLRYIMDDTLDPPPVRLKLLKMGRDINPDVYIQGIVTGSYSTPFFTRRFREALFHFESVYDMLDTVIELENTDRVVFESEILGKAILNIVACEGTDVVERVDKYKHWQALAEEVGFEQLPLNEEIKDKVQAMLKSWHKEYTVAEDSQYLLMGWKGRMLHAMSAWKASAPQ
ncbi:hypothetical protein GOP47_0023247 [Adiantum capillus-veneris]|uniref:Uncharacterized protein n=1 Tax=Adiantum capillus-veneris TaxID=13818 RepID=A0A9D4Z518_ADICA|nr:hypothetical protein GOP47_0023247 [Adiantum capillus-veneris]